MPSRVLLLVRSQVPCDSCGPSCLRVLEREKSLPPKAGCQGLHILQSLRLQPAGPSLGAPHRRRHLRSVCLLCDVWCALMLSNVSSPMQIPATGAVRGSCLLARVPIPVDVPGLEVWVLRVPLSLAPRGLSTFLPLAGCTASCQGLPYHHFFSCFPHASLKSWCRGVSCA